jgi:hypothetical protein
MGDAGSGVGRVGELDGVGSAARGRTASGDVSSRRESDANRCGSGKVEGGADKCVIDRKTGVRGSKGLAGVTDTETPAADSGTQGRGRKDDCETRCRGIGGADVGVGGIGKGRIFRRVSDETSMVMEGRVVQEEDAARVWTAALNAGSPWTVAVHSVRRRGTLRGVTGGRSTGRGPQDVTSEVCDIERTRGEIKSARTFSNHGFLFCTSQVVLGR